MAKKKVSKKQTNIIKNWIFTLIILIVILLTYKCLLISITNRQSDIDEFINNRIVTDYAADIIIDYEEKDNYIKFHNMNIEDAFDGLEKKNVDDDNYLLYMNNETGALVQIYKTVSLFDEYQTKNIEKNLKASNIENDDDLYELMFNYKRTKVDVFDTFKSIREELLKRQLFTITYKSMDEIHKVTGSIEGRIIIYNGVISYEIYDNNNMYVINFKGFDLDDTISIVSSISFDSINPYENDERGYYVKNEDGKKFLVIASGEKPNGCYGIEINSLKYENNILKVVVEETNSAKDNPDVMCTMALVNPTVEVEITKSYKSIEVKDINNQKFNEIS